MINLKKKIIHFFNKKKRKEDFIKKLKHLPEDKVSIKNAVIGTTFLIYNPSSAEVINAAMLKQGYWAVWTGRAGIGQQSPMQYFTDKELCVIIARELTTLEGDHDLVVQDPSGILVFH